MSNAKQDWSYTTPDDGEAFPIDLVDLVWNWETTAGLSIGPSTSKEQLKKLVHEAFAASLQSEEGRPVRLQLLINRKTRQLTLPFDESLTYSASNLVKLAPTVMGSVFRWLVISPNHRRTH